MAIIDIKRTVSLDGAIMPEALQGTLYGNEVLAHKFTITATQSGAPLALGGTVSGMFIREADGETIPLTGTAIDGAASVSLIANCYYKPGRFSLTIFNTQNGATTAVYACTGNVRRTETDTVIDPSGEIQASVTELLAEIATAVDSIPADYSALLATIAPTFSSSEPYYAGDYVWHSGTLYRFTADHPAGTWVGTDATAVVIGDEISELKSEISGIKAIDMTDYSGTVVTENGKYVNYSGVRGDAAWNKLYRLTPENGQIVFVKTYASLNSVPAFYFGDTAYPSVAQQGASEYSGYVVGDGVKILKINSRVNNGEEVQIPEILVSTYAPQIEEIAEFIDVLKFRTNPVMKDGKFIAKTGAEGSNSSYSASEYLLINDSLPIYSIYSALGPDYAIVYFDSEKQFVSVQNVTTAKAQVVVIAPPENAVYLRVNNYKPNLSTESVRVTYAFNAKAYFDQQAQEKTTVTEQVSMARGAFVSKEGIIGRNDSFAVTDLINAEGITKVYSNLSYDYCVVYYNDNKTPIGYQNTGLTYQGYTGWYVLEKPSATKYIRFSTNLSSCSVNECKVERVLTESYINSEVEELSYVGADISMFTDIATCGDSYTRCDIYINGSGVRSYESSWGKIIERMKGINVSVYARGGATIKSYLTDPICLPKLLSEDPKQLYILCIGINDYVTTIGTADDITEDYTQNPDTFYGNYGRLIDQIKAHAPNAKLIICQTFPVSTVFYTHVYDAIKGIAEHYNIPLLDTADSKYLTSENYRTHISQGHPDAVGQSGIAKTMCELVGKVLDENVEYFSDFYIPDPPGTTS